MEQNTKLEELVAEWEEAMIHTIPSLSFTWRRIDKHTVAIDIFKTYDYGKLGLIEQGFFTLSCDKNQALDIYDLVEWNEGYKDEVEENEVIKEWKAVRQEELYQMLENRYKDK